MKKVKDKKVEETPKKIKKEYPKRGKLTKEELEDLDNYLNNSIE